MALCVLTSGSNSLAISLSKPKFDNSAEKLRSNRVAIWMAIPSGLPNTFPHSPNAGLTYQMCKMESVGFLERKLAIGI